MIAAAGGSTWRRGCRARTCRVARSRIKRSLDGAILLDDIDDSPRQIAHHNR
jgi:hypothetical protein